MWVDESSVEKVDVEVDMIFVCIIMMMMTMVIVEDEENARTTTTSMRHKLTEYI